MHFCHIFYFYTFVINVVFTYQIIICFIWALYLKTLDCTGKYIIPKTFASIFILYFYNVCLECCLYMWTNYLLHFGYQHFSHPFLITFYASVWLWVCWLFVSMSVCISAAVLWTVCICFHFRMTSYKIAVEWGGNKYLFFNLSILIKTRLSIVI